jgi:radical SAM protein with 4Fe4S-binding SPASM domain
MTALPRELQVEVTASCNLRCRMCLVRYAPEVPKAEGSFSLETFGRLLNELPGLERVTLQGLGEPLMADGLMEMIRLCAGRGIDVGFNTNGTLLTRRRAEELVDAGLAWLCVSVDGAGAATYEAIRDRGRFEVVRRNVAGLMEVLRARGAARPAVSLVFVAMRRNILELPGVVALAAEWGVPEVRVQNLSHDFSDTEAGDPRYAGIRSYAAAEALFGAHEHGVAASVFDEAAGVARSLGVGLRLPALEEAPAVRLPGEPGCDWPWRSAYVTHDGRVQPCCMVMGAERAVLGDLAESSFAEVWEGAGYEAFRRRLLSPADPPEVCVGCSMYRGVF